MLHNCTCGNNISFGPSMSTLSLITQESVRKLERDPLKDEVTHWCIHGGCRNVLIFAVACRRCHLQAVLDVDVLKIFSSLIKLNRN